MKDWVGKLAVVTGGASGIGLALAHGLVRRGVRVVIGDVDEEALARTVAELRAIGGTVEARRTDVSNFTDVQELAAFCDEQFGKVHLLFNNAGVLVMGPTWELSLDDWRWVFDVNVNGVVHGIKAFLPAMLEHGEESYVVNTGSLASFSGHGDYAPYCASKAAVLSISQSLYMEMRAMLTPVGVSVVCPGTVQTRIHESWRNRPVEDHTWSRRDVEDPQRIASALTYRSYGQSAEEVAEAIFEAMLANRFYIFTGPHAQTFVRHSLESALEGTDPPVHTWGLDRRSAKERGWSW